MAPYDSFDDFYRHYLRLHSREGTRAMHFAGLLSFFICLATAILTRRFGFFVLGIILGYALAIPSHFIYEKNKPASLHNPLYAVLADFRMFFDLLRGRESFHGSDGR